MPIARRAPLLLTPFMLANLLAAQTPQPFAWPAGASAAVVLTYDDAMDTHLDHAIPDLNAAGLRGTFFATGTSESLAGRLPEWRAAAARGHELANHTIFHGCVRNPPGQPARDFVKPEYALEGYTVARMKDEVAAMNTTLHALDGERVRTFAYACTDTTAGGQSYVDALRPLVIGARGGGNSIVSDVAALDPMLVPSFMAQEKSGAQLIAIAQKAIEAGGLAVFMFHGVGGQYISVSREAHAELVRWLAANRATVWTGTFRDVMAHVVERQQKKPAGK